METSSDWLAGLHTAGPECKVTGERLDKDRLPAYAADHELAMTWSRRSIPVWPLLLGGLIAAAEIGRSESEVLIPIRTPHGFIIQAELADTPLKRALGLMYRESLPDDRGMLFIFGEAQLWTFWMKNTRIPLDIIWLNDQKRIVHIEANLPMCTLPGNACPQYQPNDPATYVLELRGGRAAALKLARGTKLRF